MKVLKGVDWYQILDPMIIEQLYNPVNDHIPSGDVNADDHIATGDVNAGLKLTTLLRAIQNLSNHYEELPEDAQVYKNLNL